MDGAVVAIRSVRLAVGAGSSLVSRRWETSLLEFKTLGSLRRLIVVKAYWAEV